MKSEPSKIGVRIPGSGSGRSAPVLDVRMRDICDLTDEDRDRMFRLLSLYFRKVERANFEADLSEKEWACVALDETTGEIEGFSTLMTMRTEIDGHHILAFFSGDTIMSKRLWGHYGLLPRVVGRHMFRVAQADRAARSVWLLISSGYKTYRFLPLFFRRFYPACDAVTPAEERRLICSLATLKFGDRFDAGRQIVRLHNPTPLRRGVAETDDARMTDRHVAFFARANPGHVDGDELVCMAELSVGNLTSAGLRMLGPGPQRARSE